MQADLLLVVRVVGLRPDVVDRAAQVGMALAARRVPTPGWSNSSTRMMRAPSIFAW
jgi:hypothetical protein